MPLTPLISVIVPIFNEEKYIDRCLQSLEGQTWKYMQVILVDGGSSDGSPAKCDEWASRWNRTHTGILEVIHTRNEGVSVSRNKGLDHATGEFVTFVDGDDWLELEALELMCRSMTGENADMSGCGFAIRSDPEESNAEPETGDVLRNLTGYEFLRDELLHGNVHCWGRMYKRSVIGSQRFERGMTIGEDMLFVLEYVRKCGKITEIGSKCYNYYRNPKGAMNRPFTPHTMDQVKCWIEAGEKLASDDRAEISALGTSPELKSNILISVMLTAGRLSAVDPQVRKDPEHKEYISQLKTYLRSYADRASVKETGRIPGGYPLKIRLYRLSPGLYLRLYSGLMKHKK